jgi:hypothetical protein
LTFGKKFPKKKPGKQIKINDTRLYKNGMPTRGELSVFKKPSKILHSIRRSLDTLKKLEEVFTLHTFEENLPSSLIQLFPLIWWNLMSNLLFST